MPKFQMRKSLKNLDKKIKNSKSFLSVIIPAYNEVGNFKRGVLDQVDQYLRKQRFLAEVILVDDGSTDETGKLLANFSKKHNRFRILKKDHGGKLKAIEAGIGAAKGKIVLFTDFDQSTAISEFEKMLPEFAKSADIVIGERTERIGDRPFRYFRSRVLNFIIQLFLFGGIADTQCGFKAGKALILKKLFENLKVTRLAKPAGGFMGPFDIELLFLAKKLNYKIISVPVIWQYFKSKRLSILTEPARFLFDIFRIRLFDILGKYENLR